MQKGVIYSRVSTKDQAQDDRFSLAAQKRLCKEYAQNNNIKIVKIFEDAGKSATNMQRFSLQNMLDFAIEDSIDIILVQDTDRIARNTIDHLTMRALLEKNNIKSLDLVKIDVELHEVQVLEGMGKYLNQFRPDFLIEVLNENIAKKLNYLFKNLDYNYISIDDKKLKLKRLSRIQKSPFYNILICKKETYTIVREKFKKYFNET